jgi:hypothetical protein
LRFAAGEPQGSLMASQARQGECPDPSTRLRVIPSEVEG